MATNEKTTLQLYSVLIVIFLLIGLLNLLSGETVDAAVWLLLGSAFGSSLMAERKENHRFWYSAAFALSVGGMLVFVLEIARAFTQ